MKYPVGTQGKAGHIKVAVTFPEQLFMDIIAMARREKKDFSEMVSELCKVGKLDLEESDALEPAA
jgi:hypothetical protein